MQCVATPRLAGDARPCSLRGRVQPDETVADVELAVHDASGVIPGQPARPEAEHRHEMVVDGLDVVVDQQGQPLRDARVHLAQPLHDLDQLAFVRTRPARPAGSRPPSGPVRAAGPSPRAARRGRRGAARPRRRAAPAARRAPAGICASGTPTWRSRLTRNWRGRQAEARMVIRGVISSRKARSNILAIRA